ncbi:uncharacterized protein LOC135617752 isoform X2 [Musa acuminata AAA Group]|uniref:uncharacterized protein LOC135617752 isoform X2 n=1 Tax=Musa acuminata AAA Group TaxID=214697 RepID=UPI0031D30EEB
MALCVLKTAGWKLDGSIDHKEQGCVPRASAEETKWVSNVRSRLVIGRVVDQSMVICKRLLVKLRYQIFEDVCIKQHIGILLIAHHADDQGGREGWVPHAMTQGTPCFPQPLPAARFPAPPPVPGIVPQPMYTPIPPPVTDHSSSQLQLDAHPVDRESLVSRVQEGWCGTLMLQCSGFFGTEADLQLLWDRSHD